MAAGKAVFCEKPVDLDSKRVDACLEQVKKWGQPVMMGFNRRFDPTFHALKSKISAGSVGGVESIVITSRDPGPPPIDYVKRSGGIFRDMMIHDLDMALWLLGGFPCEIFATGSSLVSPEIEQAGDFDTAMVIMRAASGALVHINNSRRAVYGYDQRIEVLGSEGMLQAGNEKNTELVIASKAGTQLDNPKDFFMERYAEAYKRELISFESGLRTGTWGDLPMAEDGRRALLLADAALESATSGQRVLF